MSEQPETGSWWGLHSVYEQQRSEFEAYISAPPMACPRCGEPLTNAPSVTSASGVERYCRFGDFKYPEDWIAPSRPWPGTV